MQPRCIPLRNLRYLRENIHARVLNQSANMLNNLSENPTLPPSWYSLPLARTRIGFSKIPVSRCLYAEYQNVASPIFIIQVSPLCRLSQCHVGKLHSCNIRVGVERISQFIALFLVFFIPNPDKQIVKIHHFMLDFFFSFIQDIDFWLFHHLFLFYFHRKTMILPYILRFYDVTFAFLRGNVSVTTIQRLRFYDIKFAFLYRNGNLIWRFTDSLLLKKVHLTYW